MKTCTRCGETKPLEEFYKDKRARDGRRSECKACDSARSRRWREANRERHAENARRWREANRERQAELNRRWYEANRERKAEYLRRWYEANRERKAEYSRRWYEANRDKKAAIDARRRARKANAPHEPYSRETILARWSHRCGYCNAPAEHLDHITPLSRGGADAEHNLIPACANCNLSKGAKTLAEWADVPSPGNRLSRP